LEASKRQKNNYNSLWDTKTTTQISMLLTEAEAAANQVINHKTLSKVKTTYDTLKFPITNKPRIKKP